MKTQQLIDRGIRESNNYEETLEEVRDTLFIQEVRPVLEDLVIAYDKEMLSVNSPKRSQPISMILNPPYLLEAYLQSLYRHLYADFEGNIDPSLTPNLIIYEGNIRHSAIPDLIISNKNLDRSATPDLIIYEKDSRFFSKESFPLDPSLKCTDRDLEDFADRMMFLYEFVKMKNPDVILYPLRGAEVFKLSMDRIAEIRGEELPDQILLPLGPLKSPYFIDQLIGKEYLDDKSSLTEPIKQFSDQEKRAIVQVILERYANENKLEKILLIDEVVKGVSILHNLGYIEDYNSKTDQSIEIKIAAIEYSERKRGQILRTQKGVLVSAERDERYLEKYNDSRFSFATLTPPIVLDRLPLLPLMIRENNSTYQITNYTSEPRISDILDAVEEEQNTLDRWLKAHPLTEIENE